MSNQKFLTQREDLETKFQEIITENIARERKHKTEVFKKRNAHATVIRGRNEEEIKRMMEEDISDRTPILDVLIDKWKYFNKYKKNMIEKYCKNSIAIRDAFERMMKVFILFMFFSI